MYLHTHWHQTGLNSKGAPIYRTSGRNTKSEAHICMILGRGIKPQVHLHLWHPLVWRPCAYLYSTVSPQIVIQRICTVVICTCQGPPVSHSFNQDTYYTIHILF